MLLYDLPTFENKKYTAYNCFHINDPYGKIRPRKNRLEHSDLPKDYLTVILPYYGNIAACLFSLAVRVKQNIRLQEERLNVISGAPEIEGERVKKERLTCDAYFLGDEA